MLTTSAVSSSWMGSWLPPSSPTHGCQLEPSEPSGLYLSFGTRSMSTQPCRAFTLPSVTEMNCGTAGEPGLAVVNVIGQGGKVASPIHMPSMGDQATEVM